MRLTFAKRGIRTVAIQTVSSWTALETFYGRPQPVAGVETEAENVTTVEVPSLPGCGQRRPGGSVVGCCSVSPRADSLKMGQQRAQRRCPA
jgi:hypothetical protein